MCWYLGWYCIDMYRWWTHCVSMRVMRAIVFIRLREPRRWIKRPSSLLPAKDMQTRFDTWWARALTPMLWIRMGKLRCWAANRVFFHFWLGGGWTKICWMGGWQFVWLRGLLLITSLCGRSLFRFVLGQIPNPGKIGNLMVWTMVPWVETILSHARWLKLIMTCQLVVTW